MQLYVSRDGQQYGPYTIEDARAHLAAGSLLPTDLTFLDGAPNWAPLAEVLAATPQSVLSANPPASQPVGTAAQPAPMGRTQSAKKAKKKSKPKMNDKASSAGLGELLLKYKASIAVVVIIATGIFIFTMLRNTAPDQGEDPSNLNTGTEMEDGMEQGETGGKKMGGGAGGNNPVDPANPGDPGNPGIPGGPN